MAIFSHSSQSCSEVCFELSCIRLGSDEGMLCGEKVFIFDVSGQLEQTDGESRVSDIYSEISNSI